MARQRKKTTGSLPILLLVLFLLVALGWFAVPSLFAIVGEERQSPVRRQETSALQSEAQALRGNIYDRSYRRLAVSFPLVSVYAKPVEMHAGQEKLDVLASLLKCDPEELRRNLKPERSIVWLSRSVGPRTAAELLRLNIPGLYLVNGQQRYYPQAETAAHVLGFYRDGHGLAGLEFGYDTMLQGRFPVTTGSRPAKTREDRSQSGLVLCLDLEVQRQLESGISKILARMSAREVFGAIMEASNGDVLALANLPNYDPNRFWDYNESDLQNRVTDEPIELGSLGDLFRIASAVDHDSVGLSTAESRTEVNSKEGWPAMHRGDVASPDLAAFTSFFVSAGNKRIDSRFWAPTGSPVDLPSVSSAEKAAGNDRMPDGQVTAMQLLPAFSALVNGGRLQRPKFVRALIENGELHATSSKDGAAVIGRQVSEKLRSLLVDEKNGFSLLASQQEIVEPDPTQASCEGPDVKSAAEKVKANVVLLALYAGKSGDRIMALVLRQAELDEEGHQFLARTVERIMKKASPVQVDENAAPKPGQLQADMQQVFEKWQRLQETTQKDEGGKVGPRKKLMPALAGLSLRKALHLLEEFDLRITVKGSGVIVRQDPPAGSPLKRDRVFLLLRSKS